MRDEIVRLRLALRDAEAECERLRAGSADLRRAPPYRWRAELPQSALLEIRGDWISGGLVWRDGDRWRWRTIARDLPERSGEAPDQGAARGALEAAIVAPRRGA